MQSPPRKRMPAACPFAIGGIEPSGAVMPAAAPRCPRDRAPTPPANCRACPGLAILANEGLLTTSVREDAGRGRGVRIEGVAGSQCAHPIESGVVVGAEQVPCGLDFPALARTVAQPRIRWVRFMRRTTRAPRLYVGFVDILTPWTGYGTRTPQAPGRRRRLSSAA